MASFLETLATTAAGAIGTAFGGPAGGAAGVYAANKLTDGLGGNELPRCPDQPSAAQVAATLQHAPLTWRRRLAELYAATNAGAALPTDLDALARACVGGSDCVASSSNGQLLKSHFLAGVQQFGSNALAGPGFGNESIPEPTTWGQTWGGAGTAAPVTVAGPAAGAAAAGVGRYVVWALVAFAVLLVLGVVRIPGASR